MAEPNIRVAVMYGDIVEQPVAEAMVISTNANLRFSSRVASAIHTAA